MQNIQQFNLLNIKTLSQIPYSQLNKSDYFYEQSQIDFNLQIELITPKIINNLAEQLNSEETSKSAIIVRLICYDEMNRTGDEFIQIYQNSMDMFKFDYSIPMQDLFTYLKTPNVTTVKPIKPIKISSQTNNQFGYNQNNTSYQPTKTKTVEIKKQTFFNNQTYTAKFDLDLIDISSFKSKPKYKTYFGTIPSIEKTKLYRIHQIRIQEFRASLLINKCQQQNQEINKLKQNLNQVTITQA